MLQGVKQNPYKGNNFLSLWLIPLNLMAFSYQLLYVPVYTASL